MGRGRPGHLAAGWRNKFWGHSDLITPAGPTVLNISRHIQRQLHTTYERRFQDMAKQGNRTTFDTHEDVGQGLPIFWMMAKASFTPMPGNHATLSWHRTRIPRLTPREKVPTRCEGTTHQGTFLPGPPCAFRWSRAGQYELSTRRASLET